MINLFVSKKKTINIISYFTFKIKVDSTLNTFCFSTNSLSLNCILNKNVNNL